MEDDFDTLREYNDYLEHVEELIFKQANEIDTASVEDEIRTFQERHADKIERNRRRLNADDQWIKETLDEEAKAAANNLANNIENVSPMDAL